MAKRLDWEEVLPLDGAGVDHEAASPYADSEGTNFRWRIRHDPRTSEYYADHDDELTTRGGDSSGRWKSLGQAKADIEQQHSDIEQQYAEIVGSTDIVDDPSHHPSVRPMSVDKPQSKPRIASVWEWQDKAWGRTRKEVESSLFSRHRLEVIKGGFCSVHYHEERANRFIVRTGSIIVVEFFAWRWRRTILGPDNLYDVASLVPHMFQVVKDGVVLEDYWADRGGEVRDSDISRLIEGGRVSGKEPLLFEVGVPENAAAYIAAMEAFRADL